MGSLLTTPSGRALKKFFSKRKVRTCLLTGLNNSGKTTLLLNLTPSQSTLASTQSKLDVDGKRKVVVTQTSTCPTQGVSLVEFTNARTKWRVWDMSGHGRFRDLWEYYSGHVDAVIWVVDVCDGERIVTCRDEFYMLLDQKRVREKRLPVLIFANKVDLYGAAGGSSDGGGAAGESGKHKVLTTNDVRMALGVDTNTTFKMKVFGSSGLTGSGINEGFSWLNLELKKIENGDGFD